MSRVRHYLSDLEELAKISAVGFRANRERQYAVMHALQLAIEAAIEIGTHICSSDSLGVPSTYAQTFDLLEASGILAPDLGQQLRAMAKLRNKLVHLYWQIDLDQVYAMLTTRLGTFRQYLVAVETYLGPGTGLLTPTDVRK